MKNHTSTSSGTNPATQRVHVETALAEVIRLADVADQLSGDYHEGNRAEADLEWAAVNFVREHAKHIAALLQQLAEKDEALRVADLFQQLVIGEGAWERFQDLTKRAESAESKLAEQAAEIERLGECLRVFICDCQQWSYDSLDTEGGKRIALEWMTRYNGNKRRAEAAERAREEAHGLLRDVIAWRRTVPIDETPNRKDGGIFGRIAAFLAANGGKNET